MFFLTYWYHLCVYTVQLFDRRFVQPPCFRLVGHYDAGQRFVQSESEVEIQVFVFPQVVQFAETCVRHHDSGIDVFVLVASYLHD